MDDMSLGQRRTDAPPSSVAQTMKKKGSRVEGNLSCAQVASQSSLSPRDHREIRITYISPLWNPPVTQPLLQTGAHWRVNFPTIAYLFYLNQEWGAEGLTGSSVPPFLIFHARVGWDPHWERDFAPGNTIHVQDPCFLRLVLCKTFCCDSTMQNNTMPD